MWVYLEIKAERLILQLSPTGNSGIERSRSRLNINVMVLNDLDDIFHPDLSGYNFLSDQ